MVTHSSEVAERASRTVRLADGLVVADERHEQQLAVGAVG
jgi:ABC-type lipoprotein export system ATPase subunit